MQICKVTMKDKAGREYRCRAEIVTENEKSVWVRIPGGQVIKRYKIRHEFERK